MADATNMTSQVAQAIRSASSDVLAQAQLLEKKMTVWADLQDTIKRTVADVPSIVKLNVGGTIFETSKDTLLRVECSYFHALLGSGDWKPDPTSNAYFLDMDPKLFRHVLVYLRTGRKMSTSGLAKVERDELKAMMEYLKVDTQLIRWNGNKKSSIVKLSDDCRTAAVDLDRFDWGGVIATEALEGSFRLRVEVAVGDFFVGLCPIAGFNYYDVDDTTGSCYRYDANGNVCENHSKIQTRPRAQVGDVVTIHRGASHVMFALNDGAPVQVALTDQDVELFPVVFMNYQAKVTVVD